MPSDISATSRRRFLQYVAASPLFASTGFAALTSEALANEAPSKWPDPMIWTGPGSEPIKTAKEAINVFDFEPAAFRNVPPAHFGYMASGLDDEVTLRANREGFLKFQLRPRRLNDVSKVDMSVEIFGTKYDSPIFVSPTGGNKFFHADGERSRGARRARGQSSAGPLDGVELLGGGRHQGARRADLVPALCLEPLGGGAGVDQEGRCRRLPGAHGHHRSRRADETRKHCSA